MLDHYGNYSMYGKNKFPMSSQDRNTLRTTNVENSDPQDILQQESSRAIDNRHVVEIPRLPYSAHFTYNVASSAEVSNQTNQANPNLQNGRSLQQVSSGTSSQAPFVTSSEISETTEFSQTGMFNSEVISNNMDIYHKTQNMRSCSEVARPEYTNTNQGMDIAGSQESVYGLTTSSTHVAEYGKHDGFSNFQGPYNNISVNDRSVDVQQGFARFETVTTMNDTQVNSRSSFSMAKDSETKITTDDDSLNVKKENVDLSSMCGAHSSCISHEEGKIMDGKMSPIVGSLWDGSLQLNTSTSLSAVAFFKSGEKTTKIDWPKHIEVKGKVRLEAFEKFIQELPRSRNRALMVVSLCWKIGSLESGLTGIKEVAKGYREAQRVGYAQLSPGLDLYICPRSEAIITILAKYGFFKGMAAVEDDRDSLIGCVVWRRNPMPSTATSNKCEKISHASKSGNSPSGSNLQNAVSNSPPRITQGYEQKQTVLCTNEVVENSAGDSSAGPVFVTSTQNKSEPKNVCASIDMPGAGNIKTELFDTVPPIQYNSQVVSVQSPKSLYPCVISSEVLVGQNKKIEIPTVKSQNFAPRPPTPVTSKNFAVDDDLPEFDFGTACGYNQSSTRSSQWSRYHDDLPVGPPSKNQVSTESHSLPVLPISRQMDVAYFQASSPFLHTFSSPQVSVPENKLEEHMTERETSLPVFPFPRQMDVAYFQNSSSSVHTFSSPQVTVLENRFGQHLTEREPVEQIIEAPRPPALPRPRQIDVTLHQPAPFSSQSFPTQRDIGNHMNDGKLATKTLDAPMSPAAPRSRQMDATLLQAPSFGNICSAPQGNSLASKIGEHIGDRNLAAHAIATSCKLGDAKVKKIPSGLRKNLWDDDEMPEWCPPELGHGEISRQLPPLPPTPPPPPPLPSYPHPLQAKSIANSSQIMQPTSEAAILWPSLSSHPQLHVQPPNNQGFGAREPSLLGPGPQHGNPRFQRTTGPLEMHHDRTSISQSSDFRTKPYCRSSPVRNPNVNLKPWQKEFNEHEKRNFSRPGQNENLKNHSTRLDANPGRRLSPINKNKETLRRRSSGSNILPVHRHVSPDSSSTSSPGFSPKHLSKRRRPSLFDVKPNSSNMDWRSRH